MLQHRLQDTDVTRSLQIPSLENYLYHTIVTGTVNTQVAFPGLAPSDMGMYFELLSRQRGCPVSDMTLLGVSAPLLLELFTLSWLRYGLLTNLPREILLRVASQINPESGLENRRMPRRLAFLNILYNHACSLLHAMILGPLTAAVELAENIDVRNSDKAELDKAIDVACSMPNPYFVLSWPALIIGMASENEELRDKILGLFEQLNKQSRLCSTFSIVKLMRRAWDTGSGLSILLTSEAGTDLIF